MATRYLPSENSMSATLASRRWAATFLPFTTILSIALTLAEPRNADVSVCDLDLRQVIPRHLQGVAVHAGDALQIRIVEQHGLAVDRQLHVETKMTGTEL